MTYQIKSIFRTIQGEGYHAGRVAVFCRFAGCNLWSGREQDRSKAVCRFCDTDFRGGKKYKTAEEVADAILAIWGDTVAYRFVVFTGGEPLLQLDDNLIKAVHNRFFGVAVETNGTIKAPRGIHWLCVSPKAGAPVVQTEADELKVVYPQRGLDPEEAKKLIPATRYSIQPKAGPNQKRHMASAVAYCIAHPEWRLSIQTHKIAGIP